MNLLKETELNEITGGGISKGVILAFSALGIFIVGVIDGQIKLK